jgi:hypothetical protein
MRFRFAALAVLALAGGIVAWLVLRDTGSKSETSSSNARAVSEQEISNLAAQVGHPVFWLGPKTGTTYELSSNSTGSVFIRYLPPGVEIGAKGGYLTVATYPFPGAYSALEDVATKAGSTPIKIAGGGIAVPAAGYPSVHVAYPGVDYQVEVFDPTAGAATSAVTSGQLVAIGGLKATTTTPATPQATATSLADLKSLAKSLGHSIYWVGPRKGYTYELTQSSGKVFIRYLPPKVALGASGSYLTVATYPFPGAFGAIKAIKGKSIEKVNVPGKGLATIDAAHPSNIHLAYPGSPVQVEVFDPSPALVRQIVRSGQVSAIG